MIYRKNVVKVTAKDIRVSISREEQERVTLLRRDGWNIHNSYTSRQIDSILNTDWPVAFVKQQIPFGKDNTPFNIRTVFGFLRPAF